MTILTAVDGERMPSRPVEVGYELAQQFGEELVVLHVMPQKQYEARKEATDVDDQSYVTFAPEVSYGSGSDGARKTSGGSGHPYNIEDGQEHAANAAQSVVKGTLDDWSDVTFQGRVGDPVDEIIDETERRDARYLVVGGRKRSAVGKAVFGSTAQSVILNADVPVVTVKPSKKA